MQKVVMIAHRDPAQLECYIDVLDAAGFACLATSSGSEALATAATYHPEVAVLQIELDEVQGTDVCLRLKQEAATHRVFVLLLGTESAQERFVSNEVGADAFLVEPVSGEILLQKVRELFQRSWQQQAEQGSDRRL